MMLRTRPRPSSTSSTLSVSTRPPSTRSPTSPTSRVCVFCSRVRRHSLTRAPGYMKKVKEGLKNKGASDEEVKDFETKASAFAKKIIANFKDYEFFIGESMDPDGM